MAVAVTNHDMTVSATAAAPNAAHAGAIGINATGDGDMSGTVAQSGTLNVVANASGGTASSATATGMVLSAGAGSNTLTVTNTGAIDVDAITGNGGLASAIGVLPSGSGATGTFTFVNDGGSMQVRNSTDGGATWTRGMAIDVTGLANAAVINLLGNGSIYGNIDIQTDDVINVQSGTTYFNGIINPEFMPTHTGVVGVTEADLDTGLFGEGTLNIDTGGNLIMADPRITGDPTMYDGPAYAFVKTLNIGTDGTITYELQPAAGGTQPVGTYPQIFADVANIDGPPCWRTLLRLAACSLTATSGTM